MWILDVRKLFILAINRNTLYNVAIWMRENVCEDVHFKVFHETPGFLSWIGTYCISCVVQQRSRVKDYFFLMGYNGS